MSHSRARILIVDDLPEKLLVYRTLLEDLDAQIVEAHSGTEALKRVLEGEFAVILLDVNMPDIDGLETANLLRRHKNWPPHAYYFHHQLCGRDADRARL